MTREEFIKQFPVGSKVRLKGWSKEIFCKVLRCGNEKFFWTDDNGFEGVDIRDRKWLPYEEPKPEWDWEAEEMWGKTNHSIYRFIKKSGGLWTYTIFGGWREPQYTKEAIEKFFIPCLPPDKEDNEKKTSTKEG